MPEEKYFLLSRCEDEVDAKIITKSELEEKIEEMAKYDSRPVTFLSEFPENGLEYFPAHSWLIIKGKIIIPKPITRITEYEID